MPVEIGKKHANTNVEGGVFHVFCDADVALNWELGCLGGETPDIALARKHYFFRKSEYEKVVSRLEGLGYNLKFSDGLKHP